MSDWSKPKKIDDITMAFPAIVEGIYLPPRCTIPPNVPEKWRELFNKWFFNGCPEGLALYIKPKEGIDFKDALRHLQAVMRSFEPKHEHKEEGWAYLASLWFDEAEFREAEQKDHLGQVVIITKDADL